MQSALRRSLNGSPRIKPGKSAYPIIFATSAAGELLLTSFLTTQFADMQVAAVGELRRARKWIIGTNHCRLPLCLKADHCR